MRPRIVAGNWKLNGTRASSKALLQALADAPRPAGVQCLVMPPIAYLAESVAAFAGRGIGFGAQDLDVHEAGAFTGETSGAMLKDVGATHVLVGHSERRQFHEESSDLVAEKLLAARRAGLVPVLCVGESLHQREAGQTEWALSGQVAAVLKRGASRPSAAPCWPMSRSGRSARAGPPRRSRPKRRMPSCVANFVRTMLQSPTRYRSSTAAA